MVKLKAAASNVHVRTVRRISAMTYANVGSGVGMKDVKRFFFRVDGDGRGKRRQGIFIGVILIYCYVLKIYCDFTDTRL
jgi:hypothetical protein